MTTKPPTHTLPPGASWAERGETGSDHDTIELRLSRLEERTNNLTDRVTILLDHNKSHGDRVGFVETQVSDLEDWMAAGESAIRKHRHAPDGSATLPAWDAIKLGARTAMDEPDPEPATAGSINPDEIIRSILDDQYEHPKDQYQTGYNQALIKAARIIRAHINDQHAPVAKGGAGE